MTPVSGWTSGRKYCKKTSGMIFSPVCSVLAPSGPSSARTSTGVSFSLGLGGRGAAGRGSIGLSSGPNTYWKHEAKFHTCIIKLIQT